MDSRRAPDLDGPKFSMNRIFSTGNTLTAPPSPVASSCRAGAIHSATPSVRYKFSTAAKKCKSSSHREFSIPLVQSGEHLSSPLSEQLERKPADGENQPPSQSRSESCQAVSPHLNDSWSNLSLVGHFSEDSMTWRRSCYARTLRNCNHRYLSDY